MAKTFSEIVQNIINNIHDGLPDADTKEGTFIRDVFINPSADQISSIYGELNLIEMSQSILTAVGNDLDRLAGNYFIERKTATQSNGKVRFYIKNTNSIILDDTILPASVNIPYGTIVSTAETLSNGQVTFQTTQAASYDLYGILRLPKDDTGYCFIELPATSVASGAFTNISAGDIVEISDANLQKYVFVSNPFSFSNGNDMEDDNSLTMRVSLAISGSNIGTKNGYLNYILKQNGVIDAKIVGAGDNIMFRDGGYIDNQGVYHTGKGGMVDIYVRGEQNATDTWPFPITTSYVNNKDAYQDIILPNQHQPVKNISYIQSSTGHVYVNADEYKIEQQIQTINNKIVSTVKYYKDIEWDFSVTDSFPDTDYYELPPDLTKNQIQILKQQVDKELSDALTYMSNIDYTINWGLLYNKNTSDGKTEKFLKYFYNNQVYKIMAIDTNLNGRIFVKKDDKIYVRAYGQPDYTLIKDNSENGNSVLAQDRIKWLDNGLKPVINDVLTIEYNYDKLIKDLQDGIETKRVLTADVLVKQTEEIPIEVIIELNCYSSYNATSVKTTVIDRIATYVNNIKKLGGEFDVSDIVAIARNTEGVDSVNLNNIKIAVLGNSPQTKITANDNQYFQLENISVTVNTNN